MNKSGHSGIFSRSTLSNRLERDGDEVGRREALADTC